MLDRDAGSFKLAPGRRRRAGRPPLPARHERARDHLDDAHGLADRARLPVHRARGTTRTSAPAPTAARRPTTTPTTCCCAPSSACRASSSSTSTASRCSTTAATGASWEYTGDSLQRGGRHGRAAATSSCKLTTDLRVGFEGRRARARTTLREGDTAFVALSWSEHPAPRDYARGLRPHGAHRPTSGASGSTAGRSPTTRGASYLQRSALTLKGLTYAPTGAMLAAATTSLPETPHGERNWDYRYSWIRDSTFMLWGLYTLGFDWEANDFFYFVADNVADGERRHPDHVRHRRREAADRGGRSTTCRATRARGPCGSATAPGTSASTTSGARCSTRSTCTRSRATCCPSASGRCSSGWSARRSRTGRSPTAGSGRCAATRSTSPRRS